MARSDHNTAWFDDKKSWLRELRLLDDEPITDYQNHDLLGFTSHVEMVAGALREAHGPMVIHIDGQWGRGKSTFCRMLERCLEAGEHTDNDGPESTTQAHQIHAVTPSWFVASDRNADMVDGILHAVARAVTQNDPEETLRILRTWGQNKQKDPGASELAVRMSQFHEWVAHELGWADDRPITNAASVHVELAGQQLTLTQRHVKRRLALIFVDDLDRCTPKNARAVMDAIQQFVNCKGVAFIIAADRAVLDVAFKASVEEYVGVKRLGAAQALEKYIRHRVQLPGVDALIRSPRLNNRLHSLQEQLLPGRSHLLKGPGAHLESGVAVTLARAFPASMTIRRLKRILNDLAATLAEAADRVHLSPDGVEELQLWQRAFDDHYQPWLDQRKPHKKDEYENYFLGQLAIVTARHVWPTLHQIFQQDAEKFANLIGALTAIGHGLRWWPVTKLRTTIENLVVSKEFDHTPFTTKKEMCLFLYRAYALATPPRGVHPVYEDVEQAFEDVVEPAKKSDGLITDLKQGFVQGMKEALDTYQHQQTETPAASTQDVRATKVRTVRSPAARQRPAPATRGAVPKPAKPVRKATYRGPAPKQAVQESEPPSPQDARHQSDETDEDFAEEVLSFSDEQSGIPEGEQVDSDVVQTSKSTPDDLAEFISSFLEEVLDEPSKPSVARIRRLCSLVQTVEWNKLDSYIEPINKIGWELGTHGHRSILQAVLERSADLPADATIRWSYPAARLLIAQEESNMIPSAVVEGYLPRTTAQNQVIRGRFLRLMYETGQYRQLKKSLEHAASRLLSQMGFRALCEALQIYRVLRRCPSHQLYYYSLSTRPEASQLPWEKIDDLSAQQYFELLGDLYRQGNTSRLLNDAASSYYEAARHSKWNPLLLHKCAQVYVELGEPKLAGMMWEVAYKQGYRAPEMRRAFVSLLEDLKFHDSAKNVDLGLPLPAKPIFSKPDEFRDLLSEADTTTEESQP